MTFSSYNKLCPSQRLFQGLVVAPLLVAATLFTGGIAALNTKNEINSKNSNSISETVVGAEDAAIGLLTLYAGYWAARKLKVAVTGYE